MNVKGKITEMLKVESGTSKAGKEWKKQTIILDNGDQYNPLVAVSFFGEEKLTEVSKFKEGDEVDVAINLSSREFDGRWYNSIDGWKIQSNADFSTSKEPAKETDDLPF